MISKRFQKFWVIFIAALTAFVALLTFIGARHAFQSAPNASGDSEGIAIARFAAGIMTLILTLFTALLVTLFVRGIRRLRHD